MVENIYDEALKNGSIALAFVSNNHLPTGEPNHFDEVILKKLASQTSPVPGFSKDYASDAREDAEAFDAEGQSRKRAELKAKLAKQRLDQNQRETATGECEAESFAAAAPESLAASKGGSSEGAVARPRTVGQASAATAMSTTAQAQGAAAPAALAPAATAPAAAS